MKCKVLYALTPNPNLLTHTACPVLPRENHLHWREACSYLPYDFPSLWGTPLPLPPDPSIAVSIKGVGDNGREAGLWSQTAWASIHSLTISQMGGVDWPLCASVSSSVKNSIYILGSCGDRRACITQCLEQGPHWAADCDCV